MNEQIFLGGVPVIGFGETTETCHTAGKVAKPLIGVAVGAALGAFVGGKIGKGHSTFGTVVGGVYGLTSGMLWALSTEPWCKSIGGPI